MDSIQTLIQIVKDEYEEKLTTFKDVKFSPENAQGYLNYLNNILLDFQKDFNFYNSKSETSEGEEKKLLLDMVEWFKCLYGFELKPIEQELNRFIKTDDSTQENEFQKNYRQ